MKRLLQASLAAALACSFASARPQFEVASYRGHQTLSVLSSTPVGDPGDLARGMFLGDGFAVLTITDPGNASSRIATFDLSCPTSTPICDTAQFSDGLWGEPFVFAGEVYTGFRFGPPRRTPIDTSAACPTLGTPVILSQSSTLRYQWRGWAQVEDGGSDYILMSDTLTSSSLGGLTVFDTFGSIRAQVTEELSGGDIVLSPDGKWCYQIDNGDRSIGLSSEPQSIRVWNIDDPLDPFLAATVFTGTTSQIVAKGLELTMSADGTHLFVASHFDGLRVVDVSDPTAPALIPSATRFGPSQPNRRVSGVAMYNKSMLLTTTVSPNGDFHRVDLWDVCNPAAPTHIGNRTPPGVQFIRDLDVRDGLIYAAVLNDDVPYFQVWH